MIGAGTVGGIAMNFANAGIPVSIMDVTAEAVDKVAIKATTLPSPRGASRTDGNMTLIKPTTRLEDGKDADIVIEAVFERMDVKQDMFKNSMR